MKQFWNILKYFGIVSGSLTILYGAFNFFDSMQDDIKDIKDMTDYNNIQINDVSSQLYVVQDTIDNINKENIKQGKDIETVVWGLKNRNNFTPEQFEEILDELLKKNLNSQIPSQRIQLQPIPMDGENYVSENGQGSMNLNLSR